MEDTDLMPFGKHKGEMMRDVPAPYLHWAFTNSVSIDYPTVHAYIEENLGALEREYPQGIWVEEEL